MKRPLLIAVLAFLPAILFAQVPAAERDQDRPGAMSPEQLRQAPITFELDVPYANTGNPRHRLDLYLPKHRSQRKLPVVVFLHGGGWMQGDKADGAGRLMPLVRTGQYAGVSAEYRLSGEAPWPAQIHDCKAAIRWVRANAAKYGLDPDCIGVWGESAGGHLALMLGLGNGVQALEGDLGPHQGAGSQVAAVADFFGVTDLPALVGQPGGLDRSRPDAPEAKLIGGPLPDNPGKAKAASPLAYVSRNDPPVLIVHGDADRLVPYDQAVRLDTALKKARVPRYLITVLKGGHGDFGQVADGRMMAFFNKYLRKTKATVLTSPLHKPTPAKAK